MFEKIKISRDYKRVNEFFDYYSDNVFDDYKYNIDLDSLYSSEVFVDVFSRKIMGNEISMDNTLKIINSFLRFGDDDLRIEIVRKVLEKVYDNDTFINNYCNNCYRFPIAYELTELQFNLLILIFIKIINYRINKLSIEVLSWVIYNIKMDVVLEQQYVNQLVDIMNDKISILNTVFKNKYNFKNKSILSYYGKFLNLSEHISNDKTIELLKNININKLPHSIKLSFIKSMIINEIDISDSVIKNMFCDKRNGYETFSMLEYLRFSHIIPKNINLTQEDIVIFEMEDWLRHFSGWNCEPFELKVIDYLDKDKYRYYIFSFKDLNNKNSEKTMIGISQGYQIGDLKCVGIGEYYSRFNEIESDYIKQAEELLEESEKNI